jgi:hypothetical protein
MLGGQENKMSTQIAISPGTQVKHERYGIGTVVKEWGSWLCCKVCLTPFEDEKRRGCHERRGGDLNHCVEPLFFCEGKHGSSCITRRPRLRSVKEPGAGSDDSCAKKVLLAHGWRTASTDAI